MPRWFHLGLLATLIAASPCVAQLRVQGSGSPPQLGFACCDQGIGAMQALFADGQVIAAMQALHAEVAVAIVDFSPERAAVVRQLNRAGVPAIAWIELPAQDGFYLNADNVPATEARLAAFETWTSANALQWAAIGLDIEPSASTFAHPWRLLGRSLQPSRVSRARQAYARIIAGLQARGYPVQTYQMPFLPAERQAHSALLDRLLGTVDVRGNIEYLMLYSNNARAVGAGMIWFLGRGAQGITVGSTIGPGTPGTGSGPLDWTEFSRDLIVASHFTRHIGVYDLEGCVQQGFLPRLEAMNWSQSVAVPETSLHRAEWLGRGSRATLWFASRLMYILPAALALFWIWIWRRRARRRGHVY